MTESYRFVVRGRVQGVFFRRSAAEQARALGLSGWVRNRTDGCVEGVACGPAAALAKLRAWLQRGPPAAQVEGVEWGVTADAPADAGFVVLG